MRKNNDWKKQEPLDEKVPALPYWVNLLVILACYGIVGYLDMAEKVVTA